MAGEKTYLKPIKSKSVVQQVIDRVTEAIIDRRIHPGDKIPTEQELAESFGVSRNSVREAIKILVSYGVLEIRRPEGTFVCQGFSEAMIDPLLYGIILSDTESMESLKELREWIDIGIIYKAAQKADEDDLRRLKQALDDVQKAVDSKNPISAPTTAQVIGSIPLCVPTATTVKNVATITVTLDARPSRPSVKLTPFTVPITATNKSGTATQPIFQ